MTTLCPFVFDIGNGVSIFRKVETRVLSHLKFKISVDVADMYCFFFTTKKIQNKNLKIL